MHQEISEIVIQLPEADEVQESDEEETINQHITIPVPDDDDIATYCSSEKQRVAEIGWKQPAP